MDVETQMQAIVDRLTGVPRRAPPDPDALDEPWRTIYARLHRADGRNNAIWWINRATKGLEDRDRLVDVLVERLPGDGAFTSYLSLEEMSEELRPVDWLWPGWIPRGMVSILAAAPGMGKSLVALDLARRVIHGEPFPDGAANRRPGGANALIVDAEGTPDLLNERARAWKIDRRRLFLMNRPGDGQPTGQAIDLSAVRHQIELIKMIGRIHPALVVIDSLGAATSRGETGLQGARALLDMLSLIANTLRCPLLIIHHLRKGSRPGATGGSSQVVVEDLRGSSYIGAAARSVLALSRAGGAARFPLLDAADPQSKRLLDGACRLEVVKTNLCSRPPALGLLFEGEDLLAPVLRYTELAEAPAEPDYTELCSEWLVAHMAAAGGPVKPADVVRAAAEAGYPRRTLYRARKRLGDRIVDVGSSPRDPRKQWVLAEAPPTAVAGEPDPYGQTN